MTYLKVIFKVSPLPEAREVLYADLNNLDFESIVDTESGVEAYIKESDLDLPELEKMLVFQIDNFSVSHTVESIENQNWNAAWEAQFDPIVINEQCVIRADFHQATKLPYEIVINPKMSFGTGHHETTFLIANMLFDIPLQKTELLDMGCGTAVLAILAEKLGAEQILAIDNDEWAVENSKENVKVNGCKNISVIFGDAQSLTNGSYNVILANINRNILITDMEAYTKVLVSGGMVIFSGFYDTDLPIIKAEAKKNGLNFVSKRVKNSWVAAKFEKSN